MLMSLMLFLLVKRSPEEDQANASPQPKPSETKPEQQDNVALAKALKEARENSVPKEEYDRLKKENSDLVSQIINGEGGAGNGHTNPPEDLDGDIKALREKLYGPKCSELSNLEFCEATLELREKIIKRDGIDPFLPRGANIKPTDQDAQRAQAVADVMKQCIDEADGDSGVFTALLQAKTNNDSPALVAHLKKIGAIK